MQYVDSKEQELREIEILYKNKSQSAIWGL